MSENLRRTAYGARLQTALLLGLPVPIPENTTMNQDLGIIPEVVLAQNEYPRMQYVAIGNGGHDFRVGGNGIPRSVPVEHKATDASLFKQIPFVLRALSNDLTPPERAKYGLRRLETHDGTQYIAYYLKRLDLTDVRTRMDYKVTVNNETTTTEFIPNSSNLDPLPSQLSNTGVNVPTGTYIAVTAAVPLKLTEAEVREIIDATNIIFGEEGFAIISEIAMCSGVNKLITVDPGTSGAFNFTEVAATQIVSFISSYFALEFNNAGLDVLLSVGASEPVGTLTTTGN